MINNESSNPYLTGKFTGVRPTGRLTLANSLGAIKPLLDTHEELDSDSDARPLAFVADLHALTDQSPGTVRANRMETVEALIALGLDPESTDVFIQSQIESEVLSLTFQLGRRSTLGALTRVPTLKDKVDDPSKASAALLQYPLMMAADIILQQPAVVPTGKDQIAHIEFTRDLQAKLNASLTESGMTTLQLVEGTVTDTPNFRALKGDGKMSKSRPERAILLDEPLGLTRRKVMKSQTSLAGDYSPHMESMVEMVGAIDADAQAELAALYDQHSSDPDSKVAGSFKQKAADEIVSYIEKYQNRRAQVADSPRVVETLLRRSGERARSNAQTTNRILGNITLNKFDI